MAQRIIAVWCFLLTFTLLPMQPNKQDQQPQKAPAPTIRALPDDQLITIIAYSLDRHNQQQIPRQKRLLLILQELVSRRLIAKRFAQLINNHTIGTILRELPHTNRLLQTSPLSLPLCNAGRKNEPATVNTILMLYKPNDRIRAVNDKLVDRHNMTPLLTAIQQGSLEATQAMLSYANHAITDDLNHTGLMLAARGGNWRIMQLLLADGTETDRRDANDHAIQTYTRTPRTQKTLDTYETIKNTLPSFPLELIALVYSYLIEPIKAKRMCSY